MYTRLLHGTYLQGSLVFGGLCILEAAKTKFLSPRHCATIYRQSCSGPAGCHPPSSPLSRSPVTVMYSTSSCPHHTCNHFSIDFSISNSELKHDYIDFKDLAATQWLNICYNVRKTHIRKILNLFRYRKSANFLGVPVRESRIHRFFIIANPQLFHLRPERIKRLVFKVSPFFYGKITYTVIRPGVCSAEFL